MCAIMMYQLRHYMITKKRLTGSHSYSSILLQNHLLLNLEWGMYAPHACEAAIGWYLVALRVQQISLDLSKWRNR